MEAVSSAFVTGLIYAVTLVIVLWTAGAIYYDIGRASKLAWILVLLWVATVVIGFVMCQAPWIPFLVLVVFFGAFMAWWLAQKPSHHEYWEPNAAELARVIIDNNLVTIENVRNTEYRTLEDYTPRYETRTYRLSCLQGIDVLIMYWGSPWMCHPMLVFDFGVNGRVCMSIEVRYRVGQEYNLLRSLYRQQEMIYIVCDERDAILRRTKHSADFDCYLYHLNANRTGIEQAFMEYAESINDLRQRPRWYHGLIANCTTTVYRQRRHQMAWDWRLLFNGRLDRALYDQKMLDQHLPFETLKKRSRINEIANRAPLDNFSDYVRRELKSILESETEIPSHTDQ